MDKKKVKELMEDTLFMVETIEGFDDGDTEQLLNVKSKLNEALEELSKSDWVSVEDGLPEYGKIVNVCSKYDVEDVWSSFRTRNSFIDTDKFEFAYDYYGHMDITHWKPIEKLEE